MNESTHVNQAEYLIKKLFLDPCNAALLKDYVWVSESDRWNELVFALLSRVCDLPEEKLRELIYYLGDLGHLRVEQLVQINISNNKIDPNNEEAQKILEIFHERGIPNQQASKSLLLIYQLAQGLESNFGGKIQCYLRNYGEIMLRELSQYFSFTGISDDDVRHAFTYWLQEVLSMPISLQNSSVNRFCKDNNISEKSLWKASDALDLNVAIVDDLIDLYYHKIERQKQKGIET